MVSPCKSNPVFVAIVSVVMILPTKILTPGISLPLTKERREKIKCLLCSIEATTAASLRNIIEEDRAREEMYRPVAQLHSLTHSM